jgi:hypothetical protein
MKNIKAILIVLGVAGAFILAKAQEPDGYYPPVTSNTRDSLQGHMGYFTINTGISQPVGRFASTKSTAYGGYAMPGSVINISAGLTPEHSNLGVALIFGNYANPFNGSKYANNVGLSDEAHTYTPTVQDEYINSVAMAGLLYTIPIHKISFDFRLLGGIAFYSFPEVGYAAYQYNAVTGGTDYYTWDIATSNSAALAGDFGAGISYNYRSVAVMLNADYLYSDPQFNTTERVTSPNGNPSYMNLNGNIKVSPVSYTLGLGYQIGR